MLGTVRSVDGVSVRYETRGRGTPVVFVHGWSCDRSHWRHQLDDFSARHRVVAVDLAGHGDSGRDRTRWTIPRFGDDVVAVLDALEVDGAVLVGHSMGGDVIVEAALARPARVAGLVWVDVYRSLGDPTSDAEVEAFLAPFRADFAGRAEAFIRGLFGAGADPDLVDRVAARVSSAPPEVALPALRSSFGNEPAVLRALPRLGVPLTAINPGPGPVDPSLARHGVTAVLLAGVGHFPMLEDPVAFDAALAGVLRQQVTGR
jgi:pimeloyl-ACP methyl ester carboxylesterase